MRNPNRIKPNLEEFFEVLDYLSISMDMKMFIRESKEELLNTWTSHPDMRLSQLLYNLTTESIFNDCYYMEDNQFLSEITPNNIKLDRIGVAWNEACEEQQERSKVFTKEQLEKIKVDIWFKISYIDKHDEEFIINEDDVIKAGELYNKIKDFKTKIMMMIIKEKVYILKTEN